MAKVKKIRRRKPRATRRETLIKVLTTVEERNTLRASAQKVGMTMSTWMRSVTLAAARNAQSFEAT